MNNNVIELKGVTKSFKKNNVKVLKNINFVFKKGKIYSLTGPSGSGKSTLLNILSMIDRPTRGNLYINTKKINFDKIEINDQIRARNIGIIYQDSNLLSDFNALENIIISRLAIENNEKKAMYFLLALEPSTTISLFIEFLTSKKINRKNMINKTILDNRRYCKF